MLRHNLEFGSWIKNTDALKIKRLVSSFPDMIKRCPILKLISIGWIWTKVDISDFKRKGSTYLVSARLERFRSPRARAEKQSSWSSARKPWSFPFWIFPLLPHATHSQNDPSSVFNQAPSSCSLLPWSPWNSYHHFIHGCNSKLMSVPQCMTPSNASSTLALQLYFQNGKVEVLVYLVSIEFLPYDQPLISKSLWKGGREKKKNFWKKKSYKTWQLAGCVWVRKGGDKYKPVAGALTTSKI